jgi:hypothetical protein
MTMEQFCENFDVHDAHIYSNISSGYYPREILTYDGRTVFVDHNYFVRRYEFAKKVYHEAQDYYYILTRYMSQYELAGLISEYLGRDQSSWNTYMQCNLFVISRTLTSPKIPEKTWQFWRFTKSLLRSIIRLRNHKFRYHPDKKQLVFKDLDLDKILYLGD